MTIAGPTSIGAEQAKPPAKQCPLEAVRHPAIFLVLLVAASCSTERVPVEIDFDATYRGSSISCTTDGVSLTDLRFFVSDLVLVDDQGVDHPVPMLRDEQWQTRDVALIDLENGQGSCVNGTPGTHSKITATAMPGRYVGVRFVIGVPFELNHANPLAAQAPLNIAAMHWHWRSGYKFLRAGITTPTDGFWIHLGSTGCQGTVRNITACRNPNRVAATIANNQENVVSISVDMSALVDGVDLGDGLVSDCSSGPAETNCESVFDALGLDFSTVGAAPPQRVYKASR